MEKVIMKERKQQIARHRESAPVTMSYWEHEQQQMAVRLRTKFDDVKQEITLHLQQKMKTEQEVKCAEIQVDRWVNHFKDILKYSDEEETSKLRKDVEALKVEAEEKLKKARLQVKKLLEEEVKLREKVKELKEKANDLSFGESTKFLELLKTLPSFESGGPTDPPSEPPSDSPEPPNYEAYQWQEQSFLGSGSESYLTLPRIASTSGSNVLFTKVATAIPNSDNHAGPQRRITPKVFLPLPKPVTVKVPIPTSKKGAPQGNARYGAKTTPAFPVTIRQEYNVYSPAPTTRAPPVPANITNQPRRNTLYPEVPKLANQTASRGDAATEEKEKMKTGEVEESSGREKEPKSVCDKAFDCFATFIVVVCGEC